MLKMRGNFRAKACWYRNENFYDYAEELTLLILELWVNNIK